METINRIFLAFTFFFIARIGFVDSDRTSQKIYHTIPKFHSCFRRMNGTHQIGCSSSQSGDVGVLHYVENEADLAWVIDKGPHGPYVILMTSDMFNRSNLIQLKLSGKVNGVLLTNVNKTDAPQHFSPDKSCPNDGYSNYDGGDQESKYEHCKGANWNPLGLDLMFEDWGYPIMALFNQTDVDFLINECYIRHNKPGDNGEPQDYPLCSAEVKDAMDGAKDSPTCIRRSNAFTLSPQTYCDPLGDKNAFSFVHGMNNTEPIENGTVIIAATRRDTFSMFDQLYPGADSAISGLVSLLAAAEAIGKVKEELREDSKPIMFTVFSGEAFDYIGSGRMLFDMEKGAFPAKLTKDEIGPHVIRPEHIHSFLELSQVGHLDEESLWMHTDPQSRKDSNINKMVEQMENMLMNASDASQIQLKNADENQPLPPASLQTFLRKHNISGVVITDHKEKYTNEYYNSRYDLPKFINATPPLPANESYDYVTPAAEHLTRVASMLAKTLYTMSTGKSDSSHVAANNLTVTHLLYCFTVSADCDLFNASVSETTYKKMPALPFSLYVGVRSSSSKIEWATTVAHNLLAYFLGDQVKNVTEDVCDDMDDQVHRYMWVQGPADPLTKNRSGLCLKTTANYSEAYSPAFEIDGYDWSSKQYSTWTESSWANNAMNLRVFLVPSKSKEVTVLCVGLSMLVLSLLICYVLGQRGSLLFQSNRSLCDETATLASSDNGDC